ncbi:BRCA1-associated RING domain protein 1 [Mortierella antarctica]|nr:BRCA1-associated RING domain protein 1 [Mortierella antarctica]
MVFATRTDGLHDPAMQSQEPAEILPDHIDGILRRMEEELKCAICLMPMTDPVSITCTHRFCRECILHNLKRKAACPLCNKKYDRRSLNTLDHMEKVINSFLNLKEIYEHEYGHEKSDGPSTDTTASKPTAKAPVTETITATNAQESEGQDTDEEATQVREHDPLYEYTPPLEREDDTGSEHNIDIDMELACFDVDLDTVSEEEAAYLALQMLCAMSIVDTTSDLCEPTIKTENEDPRIDQTHSEPLGPGKSTAIETKPKLASSDDTFILTTTNLEISQKAVVERVAKALKAKFIDELSFKSTHVVVKNVSKDDSPGSGRTVKLLMGIITAAWILQFDWVSDSMDAGYWVQEDEYQLPDNEYGNSGQRRARTKKLQGEPPLFHGYEFQLFGTIQNLSKGDLEQLVSAGGGVLVPELFRHDVKPRRRPEAAPQRHVLLFDPSNQGIMHLRKLRTEVATLQETAAHLGKHLRVVKSQTLLDTIYQYDIDKLLDTDITAE